MYKTQDFLFPFFRNILSSPGRLMGIDYGEKRIGVAVSDEALKTAEPLMIIHKLKELDSLVPKFKINGFVLGYPLQTDGTEGKIVHQVHLFSNRLIAKYHLPVFWLDERYSSVSTENKLKSDSFMKPETIQKNLDSYVAAFLLQQVLNQF